MHRNRLLGCVFPLTIATMAGLPVTAALASDPDFLDVGEAATPDANGSEDFFVELHVEDEDLSAVLQMLSLQSQRNIVSSPGVSATVTANLYGVTFYEALDAILHVNGFGYIERGNFIYVYTLAELREIEQASRARQTAVIRLNYLNAVDAGEFAAPLLSEGGQIKANGETQDFSVSENDPVGKDDYAHDALLVIVDFPENIDAIAALIEELDTRPQQVLVEATILEVTLTENNAFGVDFSIVADIDFSEFLSPLTPVTAIRDGFSTLLDAEGNEVIRPIGPDAVGAQTGVRNFADSSFDVGILTDDVSVFVSMLDQVSDTSILSRPKVLSLNRQPARVLVGERRGYRNTITTDTSTTETIEFLELGTQLHFRPFITTEGMVRMELKPKVSTPSLGFGGAGEVIPGETTSELTANVLVRDGQTIVLGGLFREDVTSGRRQVPLLGDIPLIGSAFRSQSDELQRREVVFMITPSIVSDNYLEESGLEAQQYVEHVRTGSRKGLLPFSRERQSAQLVMEARKLAAEGNTSSAMHKLRRAVTLNPRQGDAEKLMTEISGELESWPSRIMLDDILDREAELVIGSLAPAPTPTRVTTPEETFAADETFAPEPASIEPEPMMEPAFEEMSAAEPKTETDPRTIAAEGESGGFGSMPAEIEDMSVATGEDPNASIQDPIEDVWLFGETDDAVAAAEPMDAAADTAEAEADPFASDPLLAQQDDGIDPNDPFADTMDFLLGAGEPGENAGFDLTGEVASLNGFEGESMAPQQFFGSFFIGGWNVLKTLGGESGTIQYSNVPEPGGN